MGDQRIFCYNQLIRFQSLTSKIATLVLLLAVIALLGFGLIHSPSIFLVTFILIVVILLLSVATLLPLFPEVRVDDDGLFVENFWKPLRVSWNEIIDVQRVNVQVVSGRLWLVRTKALTPFHRLYSFVYSGSFSPGFMISSKMNEHLVLISEIKQAHRKANKMFHRNG